MLKLTIRSEEDLTLAQKKAYVDALFEEKTTYEADRKLNHGFIRKFAKSIGFKPVMYNSDNTGRTRVPEVESPDEYEPPHSVFIEGIQTPIDSNVIADFYIEEKVVTHPVEQFSYNTVELVQKAQKYFQKVFPALVVDLVNVEEKPSQTFVEHFTELCYMYMYESGYTFVEISTNKFMTEEEIQDVYNVLELISDKKHIIEQYYCKTCSEYSGGKSTIHVEIDFDRMADKKEEVVAGI